MEISTAATLNPLIQRWSTIDVAPSERLDYFASTVSDAVIPVGITHGNPVNFQAEIELAPLGTLSVGKFHGSGHGSFRRAAELARTAEHRFILIMSPDASWTAEHRGRMRYSPGDVLISDSDYPIELEVRSHCVALFISVTECWLRRWLPNPGLLVARRIVGQSPWGRALSSFVSSLSPALVAAPPLPLALLEDQIGSLLALTANAVGATMPRFTPAMRLLHERIIECIAQRCTELDLTAVQVASVVNISVRTLHRSLAAANQTFGAELIRARVRLAERMLTSRLFDRVTTAEIGRRAGFVNSSHFARVIRQHIGQTPLQLRRSQT